MLHVRPKKKKKTFARKKLDLTVVEITLETN